MRLKQKVAVVTGSSRGIGKTIAKNFASEGASVVTNSRNLEQAEIVARQIQESGGNAIGIQGDVSKKSDAEKIIRDTVAEYGRLDILVNNAGILTRAPLEEISEDSWDNIMNVNLKGVFLCLQTAAKQIRSQGTGGKIINIASIAGCMGFSDIAHYSVAKAGVIQLTRSAAIELAPYKINVNAIGPGVIETDMTKEMLSDSQYMDQFMSKIPLNTIGKPEDISPIAVYLASDESRYTTGQTFFVDGGWLAE